MRQGYNNNKKFPPGHSKKIPPLFTLPRHFHTLKLSQASLPIYLLVPTLLQKSRGNVMDTAHWMSYRAPDIIY